MSAARRVRLVVGLELREIVRQPVLVMSMTAVLGAITGLLVFVSVMLELIYVVPDKVALFHANLATAGIALDDPFGTLAGLTAGALNFLLIVQLLGMSAVMSGHSVLHDRQEGTLPFLLLAPVRRVELLLGKVVAAVLAPLAPYLLVGVPGAAVMSLLRVHAEQAERLPPAPGWCVAFLVGAPVWAAVIASVGATLSSVVRDVRAAQQGVWMIMFFASVFCGWLLASELQANVQVQLFAVGLGLCCLAASLGLGALVLRRSIGR